MTKRALAIYLLVLFAVAGRDTAWADDPLPAPYRGEPNSVFLEWQNVGNPFDEADWNLTGFSSIGPFPLTNFDNGGGPGVPTISITQESPGVYLFDLFVPNVVDNLPLKLLRIQSTWTGTGTETHLGPVEDGTSVTFVNAQLSGDTSVTDWTIQPNPDHEIFQIRYESGPPQPSPFVIDTISIPEPSTLALAACGLLALAALGRRRPFCRSEEARP